MAGVKGRIATTLLAAVSLMMASRAAMPAAVVGCTAQDCTWGMSVDGQQIENGMFMSNPDGTLFVQAPVRIDLPDGGFIAVNGISGKLDPVLGFSAAAGTAATPHTFAFSFSLPIALSGPLTASSSLGYTLTSTTAAGAQIAPLLGKVLIAQDMDTTVGGIAPLNKGVDVGNTFFFVGGPATHNSPVYSANSSLTGASAYDLMSATLAFSLSPNSNVGLSGFVEQEDPATAPEPSACMLVAAGGVVILVGARRRRVCDPIP